MLFAGSYERFLFGYNTPSDLQAEESSELVRKYTFAAHKNSVKCVAAAGSYLVSGGADDTIHLYDLNKEKDMGFLMNPGEGAVPCLEFFVPAASSAAATPSHLFSGSADGSIVAWKAGGGWEHLKTMRGHKGSVNSIALHPTGRLALSTARDCALRMWDLAKGRCTYTSPLEMEGELVKFCPGGEAYALVCGRNVTLHSTAGAGSVMSSLSLTSRCLSVLTQHDDVIMLGLENGTVQMWDVRMPGGMASQSIEGAHSSRVRGMAAIKHGSGSVPEALATCSTDGFIKVWDCRMLSSSNSSSGSPGAACVAETNTRARLTCLAARSLDSLAGTPKVKSAKAAKKQTKHSGTEAAVAKEAGEKVAAVPKEADKVVVAVPKEAGKKVAPAAKGLGAGKPGQAVAGKKRKEGPGAVGDASKSQKKKKKKKNQQ